MVVKYTIGQLHSHDYQTSSVEVLQNRVRNVRKDLIKIILLEMNKKSSSNCSCFLVVDELNRA